MTVLEYWDYALVAISRERSNVRAPEVPDDPSDPQWKLIEHWNWLEEYARTARHMAEEAEIF
jgi:hypothetical protein